MPANELLPFRLDVDLAVVNVNTAMKVIQAHAADIPTCLPKENLPDLMSIDELAGALKFAALQAETHVPQPSGIRAKMTRARELRHQAMPVAKGLAANGALPQAELDPILTGHGQFETAEDCVSLAIGNIVDSPLRSRASRCPLLPRKRLAGPSPRIGISLHQARRAIHCPRDSHVIQSTH